MGSWLPLGVVSCDFGDSESVTASRQGSASQQQQQYLSGVRLGTALCLIKALKTWQSKQMRAVQSPQVRAG